MGSRRVDVLSMTMRRSGLSPTFPLLVCTTEDKIDWVSDLEFEALTYLSVLSVSCQRLLDRLASHEQDVQVIRM